MIHHTIFHTCKNAFPRKNGEKLWFWHFLSILAFFVKRHLVALYFTLKQDTTADSVLSSAESDKERLFWPPMEQSKVRNWNFLGFGLWTSNFLTSILGRWTKGTFGSRAPPYHWPIGQSCWRQVQCWIQPTGLGRCSQAFATLHSRGRNRYWSLFKVSKQKFGKLKWFLLLLKADRFVYTSFSRIFVSVQF